MSDSELPSALAHLAADAIELLKEGVSVPGVDLGVVLLRKAFAASVKAKSHEFFTRIAVELGSDDAEAAAAEIAKHIDAPWAAEAIERGFRLMMGTVDDAARPCIAALVAEYFMQKKSPDREFQRVGAILMDCVRRDLQLLTGFCGCVHEISTQKGLGGQRVFVRSEKGPDIFLTAATHEESAKPFRTKPFAGFDDGRGAISLLTRHGFGNLWTGMGSVHFAGSPELSFTMREDGAYLLLGRCLSVLR